MRRHQLVAFVIAGVFAGMAGGLSAVYEGQANDTLFYWTTSANPLIVSLLGGVGAFLGPAVGAL